MCGQAGFDKRSAEQRQSDRQGSRRLVGCEIRRRNGQRRCGRARGPPPSSVRTWRFPSESMPLIRQNNSRSAGSRMALSARPELVSLWSEHNGRQRRNTTTRQSGSGRNRNGADSNRQSAGSVSSAFTVRALTRTPRPLLTGQRVPTTRTIARSSPVAWETRSPVSTLECAPESSDRGGDGPAENTKAGRAARPLSCRETCPLEVQSEGELDLAVGADADRRADR